MRHFFKKGVERSDPLNVLNIFFASSFQPDTYQKEFFSGYCFDERSLVVDQAGHEKYRKKHGNQIAFPFHEGRFLACWKSDDTLTIQTDYFGSECIFYFFDGTNWAVSNSLLYLYERLVYHGVTLTFNAQVVRCFDIHDASTEQLIHQNTPISQLYLAPREASVQVDTKNNWLSLIWPARDRTPKCSYSEFLSRGIAQASAALVSLNKVYGGKIAADITGGYDSRIVLGMLLGTDIKLKKIRFNSSLAMQNDFSVATKLAERYEFAIANKSYPRDASEYLKYLVWKYHNIGVYLPFGKPPAGKDSNWLRITGGGGENIRFFYHATLKAHTIQHMKRDASPQSSAAFAGEMFEYARSRMLDPDALSSSMDFYLDSRSRIHFGRAGFTRKLAQIFSPLMNRNFSDAARLAPAEYVKGNGVVRDVFRLLDPGLLDIPFDLEKKRLDRPTVPASILEDTAHPIEARPLAVYGKPFIPEPTPSELDKIPFEQHLKSDIQLVAGSEQPDLASRAQKLLNDLENKTPIKTVGKQANIVLSAYMYSRRDHLNASIAQNGNASGTDTKPRH